MVLFLFEPRHDKTNKMSVRPTKTQITLGIRPVWSESSLCAQWVAKDSMFLHADSEDSDQTARMPRLIWVFAGRTVTLLDLSCSGSFCVALWFSLRCVSCLVLPSSHVLQSTAYTKIALWSPRLLFMHLFVYFICFSFCPLFFSWCHGLAAAYDCGIPRTFHLTFSHKYLDVSEKIYATNRNVKDTKHPKLYNNNLKVIIRVATKY